VNISDPLAFCAHDLEDALAAGFIKNYKTLIKLKLPFINNIIKKVKAEIKYARDDLIRNRIFIRNLIEQLSIDVIEQTEKNLEKSKIENVEDVRKSEFFIVIMSPGMEVQFDEFRKYIEDEVYLSPQVLRMNEKGMMIIRCLFRKFEKNPKILPKRIYSKYKNARSEIKKKRIICDFISGMTDKYAMDFYQQLFEPYERVMGTIH